ncbi:MAG: DUF6580 family putative transport protein [Saprospiraceae bacterium]|nr:DUF6580 family putative transport protein [Saprospiraceae bacterium]
MESLKKIDIRFIVLLLFILVAGSMRLFNSFNHNPISNFTPIGAMALFGGSQFSSHWKAYMFPVLTLWLTDIILNRFLYFNDWVFFYDGFLWVYGTFMFIVVLGQLLIKKIAAKNIIFAAICASLAHWLITDFGVWLGGGTNPATNLPYPKTLLGYWECLAMALPFLKNFLLGTVCYSTVLFGGLVIAQMRFPVLNKPVAAV